LLSVGAYALHHPDRAAALKKLNSARFARIRSGHGLWPFMWTSLQLSQV
jgi:hypothetical protein